MATQIFDTLQPARFADYPFPVARVEVSGALRDHVHEYPHSPGGAPEKLGRKLYDFHMSGWLGTGIVKYPLAFPDTMQSLFIVFEGGQTFDLVVPIFGTIPAYCVSWKVVQDNKASRNGVTYDFTFREDQSNLFLVTELVTQTTESFQSSVAAFAAALADQKSRLSDALLLIPVADPILATPIPSSDLFLFAQVINTANVLLSEIASATLFGATVAIAAEAVVSICATTDATATSLNDPTRYELLYALQDVWNQAQQIASNALTNGFELKTYTVPPPGQALSVISTALYGDTSHVQDLLQTNAVENPFLVAAGTVITAYLQTPLQAAA